MDTRYHQSRDENASRMQIKPVSHAHPQVSPRRPLTDIPSNVASSQHNGFEQAFVSPKPIRSPLKRTSISVLDDDRGFSYLKRRRLSTSQSSHAPANPQTKQHASPNSQALQAQATHALEPQATRSSRPVHPTKPHVSSPRARAPTRPLSRAAQQLYDDDSSDCEDRDDESRESSQHSFTSLINYDPSSQTTATPHLGSFRASHGNHSFSQQKIARASQTQALKGAKQNSAERERLSRSEVLRSRLRLAVYKVMTGQAHTPFAKLRVLRGVGGWPCARSAGDHAVNKRGRVRGPAGLEAVVEEMAGGHGMVGHDGQVGMQTGESSGEETVVVEAGYV